MLKNGLRVQIVAFKICQNIIDLKRKRLKIVDGHEAGIRFRVIRG
jgi:hypothetical protein